MTGTTNKMHVRTEVTKTYWIGVRSEQKDDLKGALVAWSQDIELTQEQKEALDDLRQALINI